MRTARRIGTILFGIFDLHPLSRAAFLPLALKVFFIRQPVAMGVTYLAMQKFESPDTHALLQWLFVALALISSLCFVIPYCMLLYMRLKGSALPFPRVVFCVLLAAYVYFPTVSQSFVEEIVFWGILGGGIYLLIFLLPNKVYSFCSM